MIRQDSHESQDETVNRSESLVLTPEDSIAIAEIVTIMPPLNVPVSLSSSSSTKKATKRKKKELRKRKRPTVILSAWSIADNSRVEVLSGHVTLSPNGLEYTCLDCDKTFQCKRSYNSTNIDAHVKTAGHLAKKASKENTRRRIMKGIEK